MKLDLTPLKDSLRVLERSINSYKTLSKNETLTPDDLETVKSGVIQAFEVAYEQSWKFMKRWLEENVSPEAADGVTRRVVFPFRRERIFGKVGSAQ